MLKPKSKSNIISRRSFIHRTAMAAAAVGSILPPAYLARSPGASTGENHAAHCRDWVRACKGGAPACSNFDIAGKYTESRRPLGAGESKSRAGGRAGR